MVKRQQYYDSLKEAAQDTKSLKKMCQLILTKSQPIQLFKCLVNGSNPFPQIFHRLFHRLIDCPCQIDTRFFVSYFFRSFSG